MRNTPLDEETVYKELQDVFRRQPMVVLGCGSSTATGGIFGIEFPGMEGLAQRLREKLPTRIDSVPDAKLQWKECDGLLDKLGLEGALQESAVKDQRLLREIVNVTAEAIGDPDRRFRELVARGKAKDYPLRRLVEFLVRSVAPWNPKIHIVTPNYDHLVEMTCDAANIRCVTHFEGIIIRCFNRDKVRHLATKLDSAKGRKRRGVVHRVLPHVLVYKPHGSLGWFQSPEGPVEVHDCSLDLDRIMVTPGVRKYESCLTSEVLDCHRQWANEAVRKADALFFYGYGFNDRHLETAISARLTERVPAVVLARKLSVGARSISKQHPHVWCLEEAQNGFTRCYQDGLIEIIKGSLWELGFFLKSVMGA